MKYLKYKGYTGNIEYSKEDKLLFGRVLGIRGLISYEGKSGEELEMDFRNAIDDYIEMCEAKNIKPEKPYKGSFNVRLSPELHQKAALLAMEERVSLNRLVAESIRERVEKQTPRSPKSGG